VPLFPLPSSLFPLPSSSSPPVKVHILRPDSVTPIARYLDRREQNGDSFAVQLEFATVLLYREREYRVMNQSRWLTGTLPAPSPDSPFTPYDLTADAAAILVSVIGTGQFDILDGGSPQPDDLFGLKSIAAEGLARTLRPIRSQRLGWVIYARLLLDLCRFRDAIDAAERAVMLGEPLPGLAVIYDAAVMASTGPNSIGESEQIADKATARAKRLTKKDFRPMSWSRRTMDAFEERVRRSAIRARTRVEGKAFTRFLSTELAFCERERKTALKTFDAARVPRQLRHLVPLARVLGVGDDSCRALFIRRMPISERRAAAKRVRDAADAIDAWLKQLKEPYDGEAAAFFWLLEAAEEMS
jgi:hypothetical protein